jgi:hypothetical protein
MHRITRRSVAVLVVIGALVAGGAAYTNSLSVDTAPVVGYVSSTVAGGELADQSYTFDTSDNITGVTLTFVGDVHTDIVRLGENSTGMSACSTSTAGTYASPNTTFSCTGLTWPAAAFDSLQAAITNP